MARILQRRLVPDDLQITDRRYGVTLSLWACRACGFIFAHDDEVQELLSLYARFADPGYEESQETRALQMGWLLRTAQAVHPTAVSVLDIGAGMGLLVAAAQRMGLQAVGVEPSQALVERARAVHAVALRHGVFPHASLTGHTFDLIFLVDVLEHVSAPVALLRDCAAALNPGGFVVVVTPDVGSVAATLLGQRWWHFRLAHVGYFNQRSLTRASQAAGLAIVQQQRARWFFPVGYLAERLAVYLPLGGLNRWARRGPRRRWLYDRVVPLNLHDSFVVCLQRPGDARPHATA
jgi:2-polyprenyl-3-methyl-5-hydroxy-6-metoxy-1,4-benzoquinol methylase